LRYLKVFLEVNSHGWSVVESYFYFYEALEVLPVMQTIVVSYAPDWLWVSRPIELTLAYNQLREIGTGIILVPSQPIKDQFVKSAKEFGINLVDYRDWLWSSGVEEQILISLPTVVYNDIKETREVSNEFELIPVNRAKKKLSMVRWIVGDEVHHAGCKTWNTIFLGLPNLTRSHGFSALPIESSCQSSINFAGIPIEDAMTISIVGPVIYERSTRELKEFLNIPTLINLKYTWPKKHVGRATD
jgi:hypothetical protein